MFSSYKCGQTLLDIIISIRYTFQRIYLELEIYQINKTSTSNLSIGVRKHDIRPHGSTH